MQSARTLPATNGTYGHYYSGGDDLANSMLTLFTPTASHINPGPYDQRPGTSVTQVRNNGNDRLGITGTNGRALTSVDSVQGSVERSFEQGFFKSVKAGLRFENNDFVSTGTRNTAQGINPVGGPVVAGDRQSLRADLRRRLHSRLHEKLGGGGHSVGAEGGHAGHAAAGQTLTQYGLVNNDADPGFSSYNFSVKNRISSAYVSSIFGTSVFGVPLKGNLGGRYEATRETVDSVDTSNLTVTIPGGTKVVTTKTPREFEQTYRNFLPSLVAKADLSDKLALRGAAYRTFVRPQPRDITPSTVVTRAGAGRRHADLQRHAGQRQPAAVQGQLLRPGAGSGTTGRTGWSR